MVPVTIYCYEIKFIVTSKSRTQKKQLIVIDQLWHLVRMKKIIAQSVTGELEVKEADGRINVKNGGNNYKCLTDAVTKGAFGNRVPLKIWGRLPNHLTMKFSAPTTGQNKGRTIISVGLIQEYQLHVDMNGLPNGRATRQIRFIDPGFDSSKIRNARDYVPMANSMKVLIEEDFAV